MSNLTAMGRDWRTSCAATLMVIACLWTGAATAQPKEEGGAEGPRRGPPPPEALAACKSQAAGAACSVALGSNTLKGTCWAPEGKPRACRPAGAPAPAPDGDKPAAGGK